MTFKELKAELDKLSAEQLDQTATIYSAETEEYYQVIGAWEVKDDDDNDFVLNIGHFVIEIE